LKQKSLLQNGLNWFKEAQNHYPLL